MNDSLQEDSHVVEFAHILCPTDLSDPSVRPLTYAAALARWSSARLTALHVVPTFDPMSVRSTEIAGAMHTVYPVSRDEVIQQLTQVTQAAGAADGDLVLATEAGDPAATIIDQAVAIPADLVVMGTHGRSGFERMMLGSVAEKVLRKAPCPVMMIPPHVTAVRPDDVQFPNVLCPIDFSPASMQAFGVALNFARQTNGTVTLLHVIEWLAEHDPRAYAGFDVSAYRQHLADDATERMQALETGQKSVSRQEVVAVGRAHREILRAATESSASLIVMGAQGRGGIGLTLFGSTTQQVVREATCPVMAVRAVDFPESSL
jgi:nucleotide-binding universal stress UspA family protein